MKKLGVNRLRLHEISGLRKSVFDKLVLSMIALKKEVNEENVSKVKTTKRTHTFVEAVEAKAKGEKEYYLIQFFSTNFLKFSLSFG